MKQLWNYTKLRGFKLAITSEIIGKLGGADVETATVAGQEFTTSNVVVHTVEVPPGKSLLVGFVCRFSKLPSLASHFPELKIGNVTAVGSKTNTDTGISAIITETSTLTISGSSGINSSILSGGTVYTVEM